MLVRIDRTLRHAFLSANESEKRIRPLLLPCRACVGAVRVIARIEDPVVIEKIPF